MNIAIIYTQVCYELFTSARYKSDMHIQDAATTPTALRAKEVETVSRQFEASFLAEMLRFSGIGQSMGDYGGGVGEQYFAPLLADFYAESLVKAGGVGISERVAAALLKGSSLDE